MLMYDRVMATDEAPSLGTTLRDVRDLHGRSLKAVAGPAQISVAYLVKLEKDEVATPSPHVLHRLADVLGVEYEELMRLAGYVVPGATPSRSNPLLQALGAQGVTVDETRALAAFLEIYRGGKQR